jgi:aminocarboxymuconate-semialdehyde decarboxylase
MAGNGTVNIDMHCHVFSPSAKALIDERYSALDILTPDRDPYMFFAHPSSRGIDEKSIPELVPKMVGLEPREADMDATRVDIQVVSPVPIQFYYWTDPAFGADLARAQNNDVAELVKGNPDRFVAMGTLPMQDAAASVIELRRAVNELGVRAFIVSTNIDGVELSDARFDPIYAAAVALDVPLFLHPFGFTDGSRLRPYFMHNCVGQPLEEQIAITHLIFGGVLDRHPGIKICIAHGGGYFPYYAGRMDHSWEYRPELRELIDRPPSEYLRELYYDTVVFRADALEYLVNMVGVDRLMMGTDYPFDMQEFDPVGFIEGATGLSESDRAKICGGTASDLMRIG